MNDEMQEILADFLAESTEMLEMLDQHFVTLENDPQNIELLNEIFRCMHSMKGSAGFLGFTSLVEVAHQGESLLNKLRNREMEATKPIIDIILETVDVLKALQSDICSTGGDTHVETDLVINKLVLAMESAADDKPQPSPISPDGGAASEASSLHQGIETTGAQNSLSFKDFTSNPSSGMQDSTIGLSLNPSSPVLSDMLSKMNEVASQTMEVVAQGQQKGHGGREEDQSVRVETRRLDHVMNLVGELVLGRNRLLKLGIGLEEKYENDQVVRELGVTLGQLNLVASDLQLAVMKTRMVPIRKVFAKFPRLVRDLSSKLGKQIQLELSGEDTEVDKSVADELGDPLVHLVRNAVDHAIESAEERVASGKNMEGVVHLMASQEGNSIVVRVIDDGRGLQIEKIKANALAKGLVTEQELAGMDPREAMNLIFLPGFSTAEAVSDVSGRGVGMDVVRTNIGRMNGSIELDSEPSKGCQVTIKLPLTLAIIQALLVEVESSTFAIPLASVVEAVKVTREEIKTLNGKTVLNLRERILPLVRLTDEFGIPSRSDAEECYVVVVSVGERRLGIVVDRLRAQEEVVIKSLGKIFETVVGVAGATITGDGKVVLILDMTEMIQRVGTVTQAVPA